MDNYQAYWLQQQRLRNAKQDPVKPIQDVYSFVYKLHACDTAQDR
jgi:hypothetical protein